MRKIAQEVTKAVAEQGRAARDIIKAAQSDDQAGGRRCARRPAEQAKSAAEITQAAESMRRGAADDRRARSPSRRRASEQIAQGGRRA